MKCPSCHFENPSDTVYCGKCAARLKPEEKASVPYTETLQRPMKELARGTVFAGRYEIIEELGKGGMGRVYRVEDKKINEEIVLKLIKPEIAADRETIERFGNELKIARKIAHKNVCRMYHLGEEEGAHYITMEYVPGEDLKSTIRRIGLLPIGKAIAIAKQVCEGLAEAHRLGIVHRDLKPRNIMIDQDGNAKIMDFGIARSLRVKGITGTGMMIGTPEYMSPEQVEGQEVDQRSDIYSLGIILYEMLTAHLPFEGDTPLSIALKHKAEAPPDVKKLNPQIPDELSLLIVRCLEKAKEKRFQSAEEVHSELEKIEKGITTIERVIPKRKVRIPREINLKLSLRKLLASAALIIIGVTVVVVSSLKKPVPVERSVARFSIVLPSSQNLEMRANSLALSPDGKRLVYSADDKLFRRDFTKLEAEHIRGTAEDSGCPFFSPDGQWIGFWMNGELMKISLSGGAPVSLCAADLPLSASWGEDGTIVFSQGRKGIWRISASGGKPEQLINLDPGLGEFCYGPEILPGGQAVLFTVKTPNSVWDDGLIVVHSLASGQRKVLIRGGTAARYVPSGHLVYARGGTLFAVAFDPDRLEVRGGPAAVVEGISQTARIRLFGAAHFSFSGSGCLAYVPALASPLEIKRSLVWADRNGKVTRAVREQRNYAYIRLSPEGRRVAAAVMDERGSMDIWVYDLLTGLSIPLTRRDDNVDPIWTPDGKKIIFSSASGASAVGGGSYADLFWIHADGSTMEAQPILARGNRNYAQSCSPDGKFLMIREGEKPADTGTPQQIILVQNWFEELKRLVPTGK